MHNKNGQYKSDGKIREVPRPENVTQKPQVDLRNEIKKGRSASDGHYNHKKER